MNDGNMTLKQALSKYATIDQDNYTDIIKDLYYHFGIHCISITSVEEIQKLIIANTKFLDIIPDCKLSTRLAYILKDKNEIVKCKICGKPILLNCIPNNNFPQYHNQCLIDRAIANGVSEKQQASLRYEKNYKHLNIPDKTTNIYYQNNPILFDELLTIVEHYCTSYFNIVRSSKNYIGEWIDSQVMFLDKTIKYSTAYKSYCILFGLQHYPKCKYKNCQKEMKNPKSFLGMFGGFRNFCSNSCAQSDEVVKKSTKRKFKYCYDNQNFDSMPEIAYYIWLKDNNIDFTYHEEVIHYKIGSKDHVYLPDFYLIKQKQLVEIKGKQFFDKDGHLIFPSFYKASSKEQYQELNMYCFYKEKCMKENNVKIIRDDSEEFNEILRYINQKYGRNYLKTFKIRIHQGND